MDELRILEMTRNTLLTTVVLVTPALLVGMFVGISISLFQTLTSLQEQTLTLVPKMLAVVATILLLLPWILDKLKEFTLQLFAALPTCGPLTP